MPEQKEEEMPNYGYYLPLSETLFESVCFLELAPKTEGLGADAEQKTDKDGTPLWVLTALVKFQGQKRDTEVFTLAASRKDAEAIKGISELALIRLRGLSGGKWAKAGADKTNWSFSITGIEVL